MTPEQGSKNTAGPEDGENEGMGCWWLVAIGIVVLFGVLTAFLVLTGG